MADSPITYTEELKRKLIHLSSLWMVFAVVLIPNSWVTAGVFALLLAITVGAERAYVRRVPIISQIYAFLFGHMLRKTPKPGAWLVSGGAYVLMSALLVTVLYSQVAAGGAMTVMLTGDAAAALIGRRFGRHKTANGKSLEGVAGFILVGGLALTIYLFLIGASWQLFLAGFVALFPACMAEFYSKQIHIDDNFSVPLIVGVFLQAALYLM
ncbi:MAG: hypothetical protein LBM70_01685 [Victivallales bacterium]|nr:hypothetical protein [Victivallales bacterium]